MEYKNIGRKSSVKSKHEIRISSKARMQVRTAPDGTRSVSGYFATFGTLSHDMGFREVLQKGCFADSLASNPVQCLFNHSIDKLLGRTESSTLEVSEDSTGLRFKVQLPDTTYANDLVSLLERGDSFECSFGFIVPDGGDEWSSLPDGQILRTITKAILFEGSILVSPAAYPNTSANLRSMPADLRAKLSRRDFDDDEPECDPDSPDYDPDMCDDDEDRCECRCGLRDCASLQDDQGEDRQRTQALLLRRLRS
jgi:HK97 family phage prohead protease